MLGIYCRISGKKEEGKDVSVEVQQIKGIALSKELNLKYKTYKDEGVSGTLPISERPAFNRLRQDIEDNIITDVFVYDNSRLERNTEQRFKIIALFKLFNIRLFTESGLFDYNDAQIALYGNFESLFNSYFVATTKKKIIKALDAKIAKGEYRGGIYPFGYTVVDKKLIINPEEAKTVKNIFELSLGGMGLKSISQWLNDNKVPTRYNRIGSGQIKVTNRYTGLTTSKAKKDIKWSGNTVRNILTNTIYKGEKKHRNTTIDSPSIVTAKYWQEVQDNLKNNRNNSGKTVKHKYLLKGLLGCGRCGRNYYGRSRVSKKDHYYQCSSKREISCGSRSINIDRFETFVWHTLFLNHEILVLLVDNYSKSNNKQIITTKKTDLKSYELSNIKLREDISKLLDLKISGNITTDILNEKIVGKESEMETNIEQIDALKVDILQLENEKDYVEELNKEFLRYINITDFDLQKDILKKYIKRIMVFDPPHEIQEKFSVRPDELIIEIIFKISIPSFKAYYTKSHGFNLATPTDLKPQLTIEEIQGLQPTH